MRSKNLKLFILLVGLLLPTIQGGASHFFSFDGYSNILIREGSVQGTPRSSSIQASINGHALSVVFTENLGQVQIEVTSATGDTVDLMDMYTPNGYNAYITYTGSYVVTFTLSNGDVYYGEFDVTD